MMKKSNSLFKIFLFCFATFRSAGSADIVKGERTQTLSDLQKMLLEEENEFSIKQLQYMEQSDNPHFNLKYAGGGVLNPILGYKVFIDLYITILKQQSAEIDKLSRLQYFSRCLQDLIDYQEKKYQRQRMR